MSDLLNQASLVMIPSGYKEDTVFSQIPLDGSGDMNLTRASNGTRINSAGLVEVCPWNLASYSEDFSNAAWVKTTDGQVTITANATTAPNGTTTADKMIASAIAGFHCVAQTQSLVAGVFTISIYAKASEYSFLQIFDSLTTDFANFNLTTGAVATVDQYTATIENVGNGWYRCTATKTNPSGNFVFRYGIVTTGTATRGESFTGNGVNGLFIYGAQLNIGSTAKPYFPTTDRLNVPRLTYQNGGGGCPSLLLEKQSTNLVSYSEQFDDSYWSKAGVSVTANNTTSPDGTTNADKLASSGAGNDEYIQRPGLTTTAGTYTSSIFVKNVNAGITVLMAVHLGEGSQTSDMRYNWSTNTITTAGTNVVSAKATNYGNGWVRLEFTYTIGTSVTGHWYRVYVQTGTSTNSIYIYGAQLEASSYATSYIPTTSSSATRVADACFKTGISSLIGQSQGTLFIDMVPTDISGQGRYMNIEGAASDTDGWIAIISSGSTPNTFRFYGDGFDFSGGTCLFGVRTKAALAYKNGVLTSAYVNGASVGTLTAVTTGKNYANLKLGYGPYGNDGSCNVNEAVIFPTALTNAELASLTTL